MISLSQILFKTNKKCIFSEGEQFPLKPSPHVTVIYVRPGRGAMRPPLAVSLLIESFAEKKRVERYETQQLVPGTQI